MALRRHKKENKTQRRYKKMHINIDHTHMTNNIIKKREQTLNVKTEKTDLIKSRGCTQVLRKGRMFIRGTRRFTQDNG